MKNGIKIFFNTVKVFLLFTLCAILFYYGMTWVHQEYQNYQKYDEPEGSAVKVFEGNQENTSMSGMNRFIYFFLNGE